jgi:tyrosine-protein kinase Etk/Wzc
MLSVCIVLVNSTFRKGIESPEQLEDLGINVYASIPISEWQRKKDLEIKIKDSKGANLDLLLASGNPTDLAVEAIRSLRTSLHFAMMEAKNNTLMIAGASPAIGKTFVSANLAAVIAQSGSKVLLIDGDMRKGYMHGILGCERNEGLSDILLGSNTAEEVIKETKIQNLFFISRGTTPPNPAELLMHKRLEKLLDDMNKLYDIILIDTPPILAVTDAAIIGRYVGTSLIVARFEVNTPKEVEVSIKRFEQNGVEIKGVIVNAMVKKMSNYYGYYQYSYGKK